MSPIGPGRGHFETMEIQGEFWTLSGWICHPDLATTAVVVSVDGVALCELVPTQREDVARIFDWIPHAAASGFRSSKLPRQVRRADAFCVEARRGQATSSPRLRTTLATRARRTWQHPPPELMQRVSGSPDPRFLRRRRALAPTPSSSRPSRRYRDWGSISANAGLGMRLRPRERGASCAPTPGLEVHGRRHRRPRR